MLSTSTENPIQVFRNSTIGVGAIIRLETEKTVYNRVKVVKIDKTGFSIFYKKPETKRGRRIFTPTTERIDIETVKTIRRYWK